MSSVEARIRQWFSALSRNEHPLVTGDPAAEGVLRELTLDPSPHVQTLATVGLNRIESRALAR
ncbi:MAG: hypothetical protein L0Y71_18475 [Gemmataceae bacterium]|nr:hypothetical protein [Gemmataceae bacterium]